MLITHTRPPSILIHYTQDYTLQASNSYTLHKQDIQLQSYTLYITTPLSILISLQVMLYITHKTFLYITHKTSKHSYKVHTHKQSYTSKQSYTYTQDFQAFQAFLYITHKTFHSNHYTLHTRPPRTRPP